MPYHYTDQTRETDPHALPDVETFEACALHCEDCETISVLYGTTGTGYVDCPSCSEIGITNDPHYFFAHGFPGCLWDSDPVGPFDTEAEALAAAREEAGLCPHGVSDDGDGVCEDCPAPELWALRNRWTRSRLLTFRPGIAGESLYSDTGNIFECATWINRASANRSAPDPNNWIPFRLSDADARRWGRSE